MSTEQTPGSRPYHMRKRLEDIGETRRRIVEATVELHGTVGPANTTYAGVAAGAGVQRSTVYRHFPNDEALFGACTSHWFARHPWPNAEAWRGEPDPTRRVALGLGQVYHYYADNEQMLANAFRDIEVMPTFVGEILGANLENAASVLVEAWPDPDGRSLQIAVRHALDLRAWQSLAAAGADPDEAAELMAAMITCPAA